ncbi:phosphotriesterase [soil metagenome]
MINESIDFGLDDGEAYEPADIPEPVDLDRPHVMTVLGPIRPDSLGVTLHHEHLICKPGRVGVTDPDLFLDDAALALAELEDAFQVGLRAIVDMTPADYGREVDEVHWIAQRSPVHIVIVTGHHKDRFSATFPGMASVPEIAERMLGELRDGIGQSGVRAGVIKVSTSLDQISEVEARVLEAAAIAHRSTGAPISTHTEKGTMALEQVARLGHHGVEPNRIIVGHLDFVLEEPYLTDVLETGAFISFDQVSKEKYGSDADRAQMLYRLAELGFFDQLLFSGDLARRSYHRAYGGEPGFRYLVERFPLALMDAGFEAIDVRRLLVGNPAKALTVQPVNQLV